MPIKLGKYSFTGPVESIDKVKNRPGVYAVVCKVDGEYFLIDVGESSRLRTRIENHIKRDCWTENCKGQLAVYVHYTLFIKQPGRLLIEKELRELFHPDCKRDEKILFPEVLF
jgi:hypothetical protein